MESFHESEILEQNSCIICGSHDRKTFVTKKSQELSLVAKLYQCKKCGIVYSASSLNEETFARFYEFKHKFSNYTKYASFAQIKNVQFRDRLQKAQSKLGRTPNLVLDLGCGEGQGLEVIRDLGWTGHGIDISETALKKAKEKGFEKVFRGNLEDFELDEPVSYDVVTLFDVLDHVRNPLKVLQNAHSKLAPGGVIQLDVCDINSAYRFIMGRAYTNIIPFEHLTYFSRKTLTETLRKCGFKEIQIEASKRLVNIEFLAMTFEFFDSRLSRYFSLLTSLIPKSLRTKCFGIPVGMLSATAKK